MMSRRRFHGDHRTCAERRAARREARRARKEEKRAKRAGVLRLEGEEGQGLPAYADVDEIVEKA